MHNQNHLKRWNSLIRRNHTYSHLYTHIEYHTQNNFGLLLLLLILLHSEAFELFREPDKIGLYTKMTIKMIILIVFN